MKKRKRIDDFFKQEEDNNQIKDYSNPVIIDQDSSKTSGETCCDQKSSSSSPSRCVFEDKQDEDLDIKNLQRDPALRRQIWEYPVGKRDEIIRGYIQLGPYQICLSEYPLSKAKRPRRFRYSWFKQFSWLEYSPVRDAAFCFPCYLFNLRPSKRNGTDAFTVKGFCNWKKVNAGMMCAFLNHVGKDPCSAHNNAVKSFEDLMNQSQHIPNIMNAQSPEQKEDNRLLFQKEEDNRLLVKTSVSVVRWLALQGCAFRGHDETCSSKNRGNFLELLDLVASYNEEVKNVVVDSAIGNAKYTSHLIQKEILHIIANSVRQKILSEIGDSKFCIIVDEARDEFKREQVAVILRYVDSEGYVRERFFDIIHVQDTAAATLKREICALLFRNCLDIQNIRGQGYDGASNMRSEWNGLQALILSECPCAYYIHCMAHQLQLSLVAASREIIPIHNFFSDLTFIVNVVISSSKRHYELLAAQSTEITNVLAIGELETGKGSDQIWTGDTRWGSHFYSVCSLINLFSSTSALLENTIDCGSSYHVCGDAAAAYQKLASFEFVFILHKMKRILDITDALCQCLQQKSQDIVNALHLVSNTKLLLQTLRDDGWDKLMETVKLFCEEHGVVIPDMNSPYVLKRGRRRQSNLDMAHHYRFDIFNAAIDSQLFELKTRFNNQAVGLLTLSTTLDPKYAYKAFNIEDICKLAEEYYPADFSEQERTLLRYQLQHYHINVMRNPKFKNLSTISDLCHMLTGTRLNESFFLVDRLIRLLLTLPVSTTTTERAFSAMEIVKTRLQNMMEDDFLADNLVSYIEREIVQTLDLESILKDFIDKKERRVQF